MSDRRRATRFAFARPAAAHLHVLQDVIIERGGPETVTVLATGSSPQGEELAMRIRASDGRVVTLTVRTLESRPVTIDGSALRYRLDLRVIDAAPADLATGAQ